MTRRAFITLLSGAAAAWPLVARAQQPDRMRQIGVLMGWPESDPEARLERAAFVQELQKLGWLDGRNLRIDTRWANPADPESMHRYAKELVALQPDLLLAQNGDATSALLQQTPGNTPRGRCACESVCVVVWVPSLILSVSPSLLLNFA